jgi:hypothetical protein
MSAPEDRPEGRISTDDREIRRRQRSRAIVTGLLLAAFVILVYAITIAKMTINR